MWAAEAAIEQWRSPAETTDLRQQTQLSSQRAGNKHPGVCILLILSYTWVWVWLEPLAQGSLTRSSGFVLLWLRSLWGKWVDSQHPWSCSECRELSRPLLLPEVPCAVTPHQRPGPLGSFGLLRRRQIKKAVNRHHSRIKRLPFNQKDENFHWMWKPQRIRTKLG